MMMFRHGYSIDRSTFRRICPRMFRKQLVLSAEPVHHSVRFSVIVTVRCDAFKGSCPFGRIRVDKGVDKH